MTATHTATRTITVAIEGRQFLLTAAQDGEGKRYGEWQCLCAEVGKDGSLSMWDDPISSSDGSERATLKWGVSMLMAYVLDRHEEAVTILQHAAYQTLGVDGVALSAAHFLQRVEGGDGG